jgi:hypothetical protein
MVSWLTLYSMLSSKSLPLTSFWLFIAPIRSYVAILQAALVREGTVCLFFCLAAEEEKATGIASYSPEQWESRLFSTSRQPSSCKPKFSYSIWVEHMLGEVKERNDRIHKEYDYQQFWDPRVM